MVFCEEEDKKRFIEKFEEAAIDLDIKENHKDIGDLNIKKTQVLFRLLLASNSKPAMRGINYRSKLGIYLLITKAFANDRDAK